jgi:hypothetical protein
MDKSEFTQLLGVFDMKGFSPAQRKRIDSLFEDARKITEEDMGPLGLRGSVTTYGFFVLCERHPVLKYQYRKLYSRFQELPCASKVGSKEKKLYESMRHKYYFGIEDGKRLEEIERYRTNLMMKELNQAEQKYEWLATLSKGLGCPQDQRFFTLEEQQQAAAEAAKEQEEAVNRLVGSRPGSKEEAKRGASMAKSSSVTSMAGAAGLTSLSRGRSV